MTKQTKNPVHPGKVLNDLLNAAEWKYKNSPTCVRELDYLDKHEHSINNIIFGHKPITYEIAFHLSKRIKGTDVRFWMDLQKEYDGWEALDKEEFPQSPEAIHEGERYFYLTDDLLIAGQAVLKVAESDYKKGNIIWRREGSKIIFSKVTGEREG